MGEQDMRGAVTAKPTSTVRFDERYVSGATIHGVSRVTGTIDSRVAETVCGQRRPITRRQQIIGDGTASCKHCNAAARSR